jgi:hypothetical protein
MPVFSKFLPFLCVFHTLPHYIFLKCGIMLAVKVLCAQQLMRKGTDRRTCCDSKYSHVIHTVWWKYSEW